MRQTIEEFAEEIGVSKDTISRLENATASVNNIEIFIRISEVSGHTLDELLLDNKETSDKDKVILLYLFKKCFYYIFHLYNYVLV